MLVQKQRTLLLVDSVNKISHRVLTENIISIFCCPKSNLKLNLSSDVISQTIPIEETYSYSCTYIVHCIHTLYIFLYSRPHKYKQKVFLRMNKCVFIHTQIHWYILATQYFSTAWTHPAVRCMFVHVQTNKRHPTTRFRVIHFYWCG